MTDKCLVWSNGVNARDGRTIFVHFRGISQGELPEMVADNAFLFGGLSKPLVQVTEYMPHSNNRLFIPIPNELLYIAHDKA